MKRVGELYEVVVFTASVSKVSVYDVVVVTNILISYSMAILYWINSISIMLFIIAFSVRVVTTIRETMSKTSRKLAAICEKPSSTCCAYKQLVFGRS